MQGCLLWKVQPRLLCFIFQQQQQQQQDLRNSFRAATAMSELPSLGLWLADCLLFAVHSWFHPPTHPPTPPTPVDLADTPEASSMAGFNPLGDDAEGAGSAPAVVAW